MVALAVAAVAAFFVLRSRDQPEELRLDELQQLLADGEVETATIYNESSSVEGELADGTRYRTVFPEAYGELLTTELLDAAEKYRNLRYLAVYEPDED